MAKVVKKDPLNEYFTIAINSLLKQLDLKEIQPNELRDCTIYSKYQGTNRPESSIYIITKDYRMISINFQKGKVTSSGWVNSKGKRVG